MAEWDEQPIDLRWRIYYGDGVAFSNEDGPADAAPALNIQAIVQDDPDVGRVVLGGRDYYWFDAGRWYGGDLFGLFDFLMRTGGAKFGRFIDTPTYRAVWARATSDPGFRPKSALSDREDVRA